MREPGFPPPPTSVDPLKKRELLREKLFQQLVAERVLERIEEELEEAEMPEKAINEICTTFAALSEDSKRSVLATPAQLRPGLFHRYAQQVEKGGMSGSDVVYDLLEKAKRYGFTIGFHMSPYDIPPSKDGEWVIQGSEKDHRHDDRPMAYYSLDYTNSYKKKNMRYLYIVRAERGEDTGHYQDNNGTWGHAPTLAVVDAVDLHQIESEMDRRLNAVDRNEERGGAEATPR